MNRCHHLSDIELIALLKADNDDAFDEIYNRYWKKLLAVAANKMISIEDAEEIVQDVFLSLWNRRAKLEVTSSLNHYLATSVKYQAIKMMQKNGDRKNLYIDTVLPSLEDSTTKELEFEELNKQLTLYVNQLPEKCRLVYCLSREKGFSHKRIAAQLNIAEKTVEAHIAKALRFLRARLSHLFILFILLLKL